MKFQYLSGLYVDRNGVPDIEPEHENIILLGNIGDPFHESFMEFFRVCSIKFEHVFYIIGTYEYKDVDMDAALEKIREVVSRFHNVHLLNRGSWEFDDCIIVGCTLWSNTYDDYTRACNKKLSSLDLWIKNKRINQNQYAELFQADYYYLTYKLSSLQRRMDDKPVILATHFLPTYEMIDCKYMMNSDRCLYASDLNNFLVSPVAFCLCGRNYSNVTYVINGVYCSSFAPTDFVMEIPYIDANDLDFSGIPEPCDAYEF